MLLAKINYGNENEVFLFDNYEELYKATFCPDYTILDILEFKISGKTYTERKASLEDIAIWYSNLCGEWACSYGELFLVTDFFEKYGKRYGLLTDFRENGII